MIEEGVDKLKGAKDQISAMQNVEYRNVLLKLLEKDPNNVKNIMALQFLAEDKLPDFKAHLTKQPDGRVTVDPEYFTEMTNREFTDNNGKKVKV